MENILKYEKVTKLSLRDHTQLNERWVQDRIAEDPAILGIGDVILIDKERTQPHAGRLDLLLQDIDTKRRFEVEIQLGKTDESHIIRTLEYWDIERKRYPQYDHAAVIIAEDITSRFLNVIGLFNGHIPLIAIQMSAIELKGNTSLIFTTVMSQIQLGLVDEDEEIYEATDRTYWEQRSTKAIVSMTDELLDILKELDPRLELKYNKFYIGLARAGQTDNFIIFRPKKNMIRIEVRLNPSEEMQQRLENAGLNVMDYDENDTRYRIRLGKDEVKKYRDIIHELFEKAYKASGQGGD